MHLAGRLEIIDYASRALVGNRLGDPAVRPVAVYLPPGYDEGDASYPTVYWLHGFGSFGLSELNRSPWVPSVPEILDGLIRDGAPPCLLVLVDGFTRYGGSQYVNSSATGSYEDAVVELVGVIDSRFRTLRSPRHRGIDGKSSGGFGALYLGMRHPELFGAIASHSGDIYFEACFLPGFWAAADAIAAAGGVGEFLDAFQRAPKKPPQSVRALATAVALAMAYSPAPEQELGFELPFDAHTGELRAEVWRAWKAFDPVEMAAGHAQGLRAARLVYFECGTRDQFNGHYGARILHARLVELGIEHQHQEFDDDHTAVNYRYVESLGRLCRVLQG